MASARARAPPTITGTASLSPQGCERTRHLLIPLSGQTPTTQAERAAQLARAAEEPSHRDTCVHVRLPCAVLDQPGQTRPTDEQTAAEDIRYLPQRPEWSIFLSDRDLYISTIKKNGLRVIDALQSAWE